MIKGNNKSGRVPTATAICDECGQVYFLQLVNTDPSAQAVGFIITVLMVALAAGFGLGIAFLWTH